MSSTKFQDRIKHRRSHRKQEINTNKTHSTKKRATVIKNEHILLIEFNLSSGASAVFHQKAKTVRYVQGSTGTESRLKKKQIR